MPAERKTGTTVGSTVTIDFEPDYGSEHVDTFHRDLHRDLRATYVLANSSLNDSACFRKDDDSALRDWQWSGATWTTEGCPQGDGARLLDLEPLSMPCKESGVGRDRIVRETERFSSVGIKGGFHRIVGEEVAEALGEQEAEMVVEGDQSLVEGGVVEAVEADSVADVEALAFVAAPRQDVGGDEKLADGQAGDGAAVAVVVEHGTGKIQLIILTNLAKFHGHASHHP